MTKIKWLLLETVLAIHSRQLAEHGGQDGMREEGLLLSALDRPKNLHSYSTDVDLADLAASYAHSIVKNHAFIDGNKRTAIMACELFLAINGQELVANDEDTYIAMIGLADGSVSEQEFAKWLRQYLKNAV